MGIRIWSGSASVEQPSDHDEDNGSSPDYISVRNVALGEKVILPKLSTASDTIEPSDEGVSVPQPTVNVSDPAAAHEKDCTFDADVDSISDPEPVFEETLYDQRPTFMLGVTSRSGRSIRLSGKFADHF